MARWVKRHEVTTTRKGRRRMYWRPEVASVVEAARHEEGTASVAGIDLDSIRWLWVEDERGRRPFFCVADVRLWLNTTTPAAVLVESIPKQHIRIINVNTKGGVRAAWHVSIGGLSIIVARSRSDEERAGQLLEWASNIIEDISLGKAEKYVDANKETTAVVTDAQLRTARYVSHKRLSFREAHRSKSLTDMGLQVEMCKLMRLLGVDEAHIRWGCESSHEGSVQTEIDFGDEPAVNEDSEIDPGEQVSG